MDRQLHDRRSCRHYGADGIKAHVRLRAPRRALIKHSLQALDEVEPALHGLSDPPVPLFLLHLGVAGSHSLLGGTLDRLELEPAHQETSDRRQDGPE